MSIIGYGIAICGWVAGACYLITNGHPWFGLFCIVCAGMTEVKQRGG